jgi:redox-sensitive bicupin YhaK (pirin superfamily)
MPAITLRKSQDRGHFDHGWLDTYHTFSFSEYRDRRFMGFRSLRVINEDRVAPGQGFGEHPHANMEILTCILSGQLQHRDSMGNGSIIRPGEWQRMSAGRGIFHSEFNPSATEPVHLLQIWLFPDVKDIEPEYDQQDFSDRPANAWTLVASPGGEDGSMRIHQDAKLLTARLTAGASLDYDLAVNRHAWLHVARGAVRLNEETLSAGDAAAVSEAGKLQLSSSGEADVLMFDLN